jgi:hypothetical protein
VTAELTAAALALGERLLAEGSTAAARRCAEQALTHDPYAERCLRLLLAVEVERRDPVAIRQASRRVRAALGRLGVAPEPATALLLRHAEAMTS